MICITNKNVCYRKKYIFGKNMVKCCLLQIVIHTFFRQSSISNKRLMFFLAAEGTIWLKIFKYWKGINHISILPFHSNHSKQMCYRISNNLWFYNITVQVQQFGYGELSKVAEGSVKISFTSPGENPKHSAKPDRKFIWTHFYKVTFTFIVRLL